MVTIVNPIVGLLTVELYIPDAMSLKDKRSVISSLLERLANRFNVAVAEIDALDNHRRAVLAVSTVANDLKHVKRVLDTAVTSVFADLGTFHKTRRRPLGEVQTFARAQAKARYAKYQVRTEDFASVLLQFANGARGNLAVSQVAAGRKNCLRLEIYGSKKSAAWCSEAPEMLHFGNRDGANETAVRATPAFGDGAAGFMDFPPGHLEGFPDTFKMLFRNIYTAIAGGPGERLFASPEDGHQEVALCEAIMRSNRSKSWMKV